MNKFFQVIFLSSMIVSMSFCADSLVKPIKVTDIKDCSKAKGPCQYCPFGTAPIGIIEQGKEITGCYKCPKDTAEAMLLKDGGFRCGKCPKGTVIKKVPVVKGVISTGLEYKCACPAPNSYGVSQPDGSVKCISGPKGKMANQENDFKEMPNGDKKFVFIGGNFY